MVGALCGLKSTSAAFRSFMAKKLDEMNFVSSTADPDAWLPPAIESDGSECCECVLCHVDDVPAIGLDPCSALEGLKGGTVKFENDKIETPKMCLGAKLQKKSMNGIPCWAITSEQHVKAAVDTVKASIEKSESNWLITKGGLEHP